MFVGYTVRQPVRATSAIRAESAATTLLEEREANSPTPGAGTLIGTARRLPGRCPCRCFALGERSERQTERANSSLVFVR